MCLRLSRRSRWNRSARTTGVDRGYAIASSSREHTAIGATRTNRHWFARSESGGSGPRLRRGQRPTVQPLAATRARGYALTKGLAPLIIVEEHPPVLVLIRLPPEFGPDSFPALARAIENSHEPPPASLDEGSQNLPSRQIMTLLRHGRMRRRMYFPAFWAICCVSVGDRNSDDPCDLRRLRKETLRLRYPRRLQPPVSGSVVGRKVKRTEGRFRWTCSAS